MTLRAVGPEYVPLRVFRDDDLLDPGSDPLIALMGALSDLNKGEAGRGAADAAFPGTRVVAGPPGEGPQAARGGPAGPRLHLPDQASPVGRRDDGRPGRRGIGRRERLPVGAGRGGVEGRGDGRRALPPPWPPGGWLWHRLKKGRKARLRPAPHQGEGLPHRLRRRASGDGVPAKATRRPQRANELLGAGGGGLPPLRQPRGGAVRRERGAPRRPRPGRCCTRPAPVSSASAASWESARRPASGTRPERQGRDAPGGPLRGQGAAAHGPQRPGRRPRRRHRHRNAPEDPLPRRPAPPAPPLRRPHPHGQVHPDAPHRRPQDAGQGRGQGRGRHRRRRSPRRPGGRPAPSTSPTPSIDQRAPHRPGRRAGRSRHQPAGHPHLLPTATARPTRWCAWPRASGNSGGRGCSPSSNRPSRASTRPTSSMDEGEQYTILDGLRLLADEEFRSRGAGEGQRPLPDGVVGPGLQGLAPRDPRRRPGPGADPPLLLRLLQAGEGHPRPVPLHHRPAP